MLLAPAALPIASSRHRRRRRSSARPGSPSRRRRRRRSNGASSSRVRDAGLGDQREPGHARPPAASSPADHQRPLADPVRQGSGDRRDGHERGRPRQQPQPRAERTVAEPGLQQLGVEEHGAEQRGEGEEDRRVAGREGTRAEEAHRQHRIPGAQLPGDERGDEQRLRAPATRRPRRCPSRPGCRAPGPTRSRGRRP